MNADLIGETEWVEYFDEASDQPYYYNRNTNSTQYELPEEYDSWKNEEIDKYLKASTIWRRQKDEKKGKYFYFNKRTNKTQWDVPSEQLDFESFLKQVIIDRYQIDDDNEYGSQDEAGGDDNAPKPYDDFGENVSPTYDSEPDLDDDAMVEAAPRLQRVFSDDSVQDEPEQDNQVATQEDQEEARRKEFESVTAKLSAKDAIMEPTIHKTTTRFMALCPEDTLKSSRAVVQHLKQGYIGYAQMTHMVCEWVEKATEKATKGQGEGGFDADSFIADEVSGLIKRKFNKVLDDLCT
jgi:hypothetical protein